jgi:type I restriction enzyme, R subunit
MSLRSVAEFSGQIQRLSNRCEASHSYPSATYERKISRLIDAKLHAAGWIVLDRELMDVVTAFGVAVRENTITARPCVYQMFVDQKACGIIECKQQGDIFFDVADQSSYGRDMLLLNSAAWSDPLRFKYEVYNSEIVFSDQAATIQHLRHLVGFHRPDVMHRWMQDS